MSDIKKSMRVGFMGFYPAPPEITREKRSEWAILKSAEIGCNVTQIYAPPTDEAELNHLYELSKTNDVELEVGAPFTLWDFTSDNAAQSKQDMESLIASMKKLDVKIMRTGYGRLNVEKSRFNKDISISDHMKIVANNLKEAAKIVEANGVYLAIENHCDFKGTEMAEIFDMVGSPNVGCALDTANGFTVFCDPNDDVKALAPYAITTHIKDMVMLKDPIGWRIPFYPVGCALGEGHVDVPAAIDELAKNCPHAENLHLIIEVGWVKNEPEWDKDQISANMKGIFDRSIDYLKKLVW